MTEGVVVLAICWVCLGWFFLWLNDEDFRAAMKAWHPDRSDDFTLHDFAILAVCGAVLGPLALLIWLRGNKFWWSLSKKPDQ